MQGAPAEPVSEISELIANPPPRLLHGLLASVAVLVAGLVAWAYFSPYDVVVTERGILEPAAPVGVVQPDGAARVARLLVAEGETVRAGQPVAEVVPVGGRETIPLAAPAAGRLIGIAERQSGELLPPGQPLARVLPEGPLVARVRIGNQSMGRVREQQVVKLKLDAYPYQEYGALAGRLARVALLPAPARDESAAGPPGYDATITLDPANRLSRGVELRPGLALTAEIVVERKRLLDLLLERIRHPGG